MNVGIVGLGLIGGSLAKAFGAHDDTVFAFDIDERSMQAAIAEGSVTGVLDAETIPTCELILIALYPQATLDWLSDHAENIDSQCLVMDCGGVKRAICPEAFAIARKYGFTFMGAHPMAGTHHSGFRFAREDLFFDAPMVLVPPKVYAPALIDKAMTLLAPVGFGSFAITTPEEHDRVIAYTSQLAHAVSSAYVKSPTSLMHDGFSAGSFKDLTRVAELNAPMWTELFLDNRDNLAHEIQTVMDALKDIHDALEANDAARLEQLLLEGSEIKQTLNAQDAHPRLK